MLSFFTCEWQLWDIRKKGAIHTFQNTYQVLAVTFNDTSDQIMSGGIDNDIKVLILGLHGTITIRMSQVLGVVDKV